MAGTQILAGTTTLEQIGPIAVKAGKLATYLQGHLDRAISDSAGPPHHGILDELAHGVRQNLITADDAVSILVVLAGAGGESTSSLTGNAVRMLAEAPALQTQLREQPDLIPSFVEEVVRLESSFRGHYRAVQSDTELGNTRLPAGSHLYLLWAAANRDPDDFTDPDIVDLERKNPRDHLGFGRGSHFCVGARLARLEVRIVLEELLANSREFEIDPQHAPRWASSNLCSSAR